MRRYVTYKRVSSEDQGRSGLGLEAQERDIQLFFGNYADTSYEVVGQFLEDQTASDNTRSQLLNAIDLAKKEKAVLAVLRCVQGELLLSRQSTLSLIPCSVPLSRNVWISCLMGFICCPHTSTIFN